MDRTQVQAQIRRLTQQLHDLEHEAMVQLRNPRLSMAEQAGVYNELMMDARDIADRINRLYKALDRFVPPSRKGGKRKYKKRK